MKEQYELDQAHTLIGFSAKHLAVTTVRGSFSKYEGGFTVDRENPAGAAGEVKIEVASLSTGQEQRDGHLKSADFFEADKYPYITWKLTGVQPQGGDRYQVTGDLTIKETTRPITLDVTVEGELDHPMKPGSRIVSVSATGQLNRMDFGLNWDGVAGTIPFAGREIKLSIDSELVGSALSQAEAVA